MNWADKILLILFFAAIITWQALHQAKLFKENKSISHFWKAEVYLGAIGIATIPFVVTFGWWYLLKITAIGTIERAALFDFILNKARGESLFYPGTESTRGSEIDAIERELLTTQTEWIIVKIFYIIVFVAAIIFIK